MGCMFTIKLKDVNGSSKMNKVLKQRGIEGAFLTEEMNLEWLEDINNNPESPHKHLKPENRNLTLEELKDMFTTWTVVGLYETDLYFGRTSKEQMELLAQFIYEYKGDIEYVAKSDILIKRSDLPSEQVEVLKSLEVPDKKPEMLPEEERCIHNFQNGQLLCKSWNSTTPFWAIYGKVEKPTFLKDKIYVEDLYNNIYKDKKGYAYMLIPLQPFGAKNFGEKVYEQAFELGLREHPLYFLPMVYGYSIIHSNEVGRELAEFYSLKEIEERFVNVIKRIYEKSYPELSSFEIDHKERIKFYNSEYFEGLSTLLNAFKVALQIHYGKLEAIQSNKVDTGRRNFKFIFTKKELLAPTY